MSTRTPIDTGDPRAPVVEAETTASPWRYAAALA
jgi:hypothetical protein